MPLCFDLTRKSDMNAGPVSLNQIDREICAFMGEQEHPKLYCHGWFDAIGFLLACGQSFDLIEANLIGFITREDERFVAHDVITLKINNYLRKHFIPNAWREIGRR